ncbi:hypothetical protein LGH70_16900 [Hymenobacter sp. BT635]|uniref:DUF1795 domain-containing protein n=1 Tax=Hymenobacter nitidus TaxID=2880929 RepID=A0ABS8AFQ6_9BACT|nr:hypothetical protein [Hymenobacter nitidus]MCB2379278.1 hypothetical protein [Hymenobacter nitidus]
MARIFGWLFLVLASLSARAQTNWPTTRLDEQATVQMPYEGTLEEDKEFRGAQLFKTTTSDNDFAVLRVDLRYIPDYNPDAVLTEAGLSKLYDKLARQYNRTVFKGKLVSRGNILLAGRPARATRYRGFDEHYQLPIHIETIWVWQGDALYQFICSYSLPEEAGAQTDKRRFFSSVRFGPEDTGKKL